MNVADDHRTGPTISVLEEGIDQNPACHRDQADVNSQPTEVEAGVDHARKFVRWQDNIVPTVPGEAIEDSADSIGRGRNKPD